jgi:hypothetical protein
MKYRKFNKYEKKEIRRTNIEKAMGGEGLYLYENNSDGDLTLPRPTKSGVRSVEARQQFQGDNYYMQLVRSGHLRFIKELQSPEQERAIMENTEEKLILDQPDTITEHGKVEHVVDNTVPTQQLDESEDAPKQDVLLNEAPAEDGFVIVGD